MSALVGAAAAGAAVLAGAVALSPDDEVVLLDLSLVDDDLAPLLVYPDLA